MSTAAPLQAVTPKTAPAISAKAAFRPSLTPVRTALLQRKCACGGTPGPTGECDQCRKKRQALQRSASGTAPAAAPPIVSEVMRSPGRALDAPTRDFMESRFGHNFGQVRVHDDARAAESARAVNALAYTVGPNVVFGAGQYAPSTTAGQRLLAHELTHVVQQRGGASAVQQSPMISQSGDAAEREADATAERVMTGRMVPAITPLLAASLQRKRACPKEVDLPGSHSWPGPRIPVPSSGFLMADRSRFQMRIVFSDSSAAAPDCTCQCGEFKQEIRGCFERYENGSWRTGYKQLYNGELLHPLEWHEDGEHSGSAYGHRTHPQVDHDQFLPNPQTGCEYQGSDAPNIRSVDGEPVRMHLEFRGAPVDGGAPGDGCKDRELISGYPWIYWTVEGESPNAASIQPRTLPCSSATSTAPPAGTPPPPPTKDYVISRNRTTATLQVPINFGQSKTPDKVTISPTDPVAQLVPGLVLETLHHDPKRKYHFIDAKLDTRPEAGLPLRVQSASNKHVSFDVKDGRLVFSSWLKRLQWSYWFLSPGVITSLEDDEQGISWAGNLQPTVPFLGELGVAYSRGELKVTKGIEPATLKKRSFLGARITRADVSLLLAPEFKALGTIEFQMGKGSPPLATGSLTLGNDDAGLVAKGMLKLNIPKVDKAETEITYRAGEGRNEWEADIRIESTQIGLPYVTGGSLVGRIAKNELVLDGKIDLTLPNERGTASVGLRRQPGAWIFSGRGTFKFPKLDDTRVEVTYNTATETLTATGETGFSIPAIKLRGRLETVTFTARKGGNLSVTGTGKLDFEKGKAKGQAIVNLLPNGKFTGSGSLSYALTPNLVVMGTVVFDENERLRVTGVLTFKRLTLLDQISDKRTLFNVEYGIPIPGASIGGIGIKAVIGASVTAGFQFGAVVIEPLSFEAGFNPLEDDPDLNLAIWGEVKVPTSAYLSASISGGVKLDVFIAEVGGKLTLTGTISLEGGINIPFKGRYAGKKFTVELTPEVKLGLMLAIALSATVWARAGVGWLSVETEKTWKLGERKIDTGLKFGLKAPVRYDSDTGIKLPSMSDVELIKPDFSAENLKRIAGQLFSETTPSEREV